MKNLKLRWLFYFVLLGLCLQAQVNNQFKLQLYLADQNGNIYVNRTIGLKISILKSENDFPIYSERQVLTSDATGLLNIPIGAGTNSVGNIASFSQLTAGFIKIEYDPSGGSNYTRMLLQPLVSVPYASISNYALGLKGRGITGNHFADSSILAENLDFNPAKKEDVEVLKSWIDTYTNGSIPTLITYLSSPNVIDTAQILAIVSSDGGDSISEKGFVYSLSPNPTINNSRLKAGRGNANFSGVLKGLNASSTYHVRSYAINRLGIGYGNPITITTASPVSSPTLTTTSASSILETSATTGGNVTSDGGAAITERGVVYAISGIPSLSNSKIVAGTSGTGTYTVNLTGLTSSTKYYFRAYATNSAGTGYGTIDSFVSLTPVVLPTLTTTSASSILETNATTGGNVTSDGGATVTERGVVYAISGIPSLSNSKVVAGTTGTGTYTVNLTGLNASIKYYFRAYATNSAGTGYGTLDSFVTLTPVVLPTLTTTSASSILTTSAITGGNVTSDGGATVSERGVVYGTSSIPSLSNSKVVAGTSGTGTYTVNLTGLTGSTKYFFRAYATNSAGTGYGTLDSLTTTATNCAVTCKDSVFMLTSDKCFDALSFTSVRLNIQNCQTDTLKVVVNDFIPNNGSIIDGSSPIGGWVYTIQNTRNNVLCSGKLHNIDTVSTNTLAASWGYLNEFVNNQGNAVVNLLCNRVSEVLNKNNPVIFRMDSLTALKTTLENKYYVGVPLINLLCNTVEISKTDNLVSSTCDSTFITRKYVIENNLGEDTTLTQIIRFLRPTNSKSKSNDLYNEISLGNFGPMSDGFRDSLVNGLPVKNLTSNNRKYRTGVDTIEISTCDKPINKSDFLPYLKSLYKVVFENKIRSKSTRLYDGYKSNLDTLSLFESLNYSICNYNTDFTFQIQTNNSLKTDYQIVAQVFDWCTSTEIKDTIILSFLNKPIIDIDGNCYDTVHIGSQIWMKENLKVTKYRDGSPINTGLDNSAWSSTQTGAYSIYNNDILNDKKFGKLYNWYAVNDVRGLCPAGWHVPNDLDWINLKEYLGGDTIAGKALKSVDGWILTSFRGNNQSGFTGLPGGNRNENGIYENTGFGGYFWGSIEAGPNFAWTHGIYASTFLIGRFNNAKSNGRSVRCIEDNSSQIVLPTLTTTSASSILATSAIAGGNVTSDGGATVTERGVVYATSGIPLITDNKVVAGTSGTGTYTVNMTGLTGSTKYYFRAYATNSAGTGYGSLDSFVTPVVLPTISTTSLSEITVSSSKTGGNITSDGGATVTERGVVWSTSSMPTITLSTKTINGTGTGSFTSAITGIAPNTIYYVRAYATNSVGTVYGNELTFNAVQGVPCLGTPIVTDIDGNTYNTVQIGMQCWTKENLKVSKYNDGTLIPLDSSGGTSGNFQDETWFSRTTGARSIYEHSQTNFSNYGYLYNGYAAKGITSSGSTNYKNICPTGWHVPTVRGWDTLITFLGGENFAGGKMKSINSTLWEAPNSGATDESGFSGLPAGYRDSDGSFRNIKYGAYFWNTIENSINEVSLSELGTNFNNIYQTGAWSTMGNSLRCIKDTIFISSANVPTIITTPISSLTTSTAKSGITITDDGGASIAESGLVWSTSPNPTISSSSKFGDRFGNLAFDYEIIGLTPNTTYYVRAYARNSAGVGYGNELSFTTSIASQVLSCPDVPTVTDIDGNTYNTVKIGSQCWTKENLKVSKYNDGALIPLDTSGRTTGNWSGNTWLSWNVGARTIYEHSQANYSTYGYLYNWYAAKGIATEGSTSYKNLCPINWHVPTHEEWDSLITYLGGTEIAGGKMKSSGTTLWSSQNIGGTNESGFNGIPGGGRQPFGRFVYLGSIGVWWSSSEYYNSSSASSVWLNNGRVSAYNFSIFKNHGYSVRCLRDTASVTTAMIPTLTTTVDSIKSTTARSGGNITSDGGCTITARGVVWSTSQNPTIALSTKTSDGTGTGSFTSNLTGLIANTTYYVRAYATNCAGTAFGSEVSFTTTAASQGVPCPGVPTVTDIDGNTYNTVQIGTQCWTKENLRVTKYSDGTIIPLDSSGGTAGNGLGEIWSSRTAGARSIYAHSQPNLATYGYLYNWYAAKGIATSGSTSYKNICPTGWHVPTREEWTSLVNNRGGVTIAGATLKSLGSSLWNTNNSSATNESGFTGLPGGSRGSLSSSIFYGLNSVGIWWSLSEYNLNSVVNLELKIEYIDNHISGDEASFGASRKGYGHSIRCLKDNFTSTTTLPTLTTSIVDSITDIKARSGGNISSDGGSTITSRGLVWSASSSPTIILRTKTIDGKGIGAYSSEMSGLSGNTRLYVRAYATNSMGTEYGNEILFTTAPISQGVTCQGVPTVMDIDGNNYNTVQIGDQCWFKENLKVTKYSDGTIIPLDSSGGTLGNGVGQTWGLSTIGSRTIYAHSQANLATYGYLYNWYAVKGIATAGSTIYKSLCPTGWHVPSDLDWTNLTTYLGGENEAGGKIKSSGITLWNYPNSATNESGFSALPGGYRENNSGTFNGVRSYASFWSSIEYDSNNALNRALVYDFDGVGRYFNFNNHKSTGASVRCLKDSISTPSTTLPTLTTTAADSIKSTTARSGGNITSDGGCTITSRGVVWSTSQNPTIELSTKTSDGTGTGSFTSNLTGLIANTTYYVRSYATNCAGTAYGTQVTFTTAAASQGVPCPSVPSVTDIDGNTYNTVQIGTQCWTKENLRVTKYSDGTIIPLDSSGGTAGNGSGETWGSRTTGARTIYEHSASNLTTYGYLYNWYAAKGIATTGSTSYKNLCPAGWHVPTDGEWTALTTFLGGESLAGGKMKSTGTTLWASPNTEATNESGFTGLPGGYRNNDGSFNISYYAFFWSATESGGSSAWYRNLYSFSPYVGKFSGFNFNKSVGVSVRCLRDFVSTPTTTLPTLTTTAADSIKSTTARSGGNITSDGGCTITARGVVWSTSQNPTIALSTKTSDGTGTGSFTSNLTGLIANTTYYVRAYATNCAGTAFGSEVSFTTTAASQGVPCPGVPTVTDIDGNTYNTVQIGTQCWTKENLRVTKYSDGTSIPLDNSGDTTGDGSGQTWESRTTGARTIYEHSASNLTTYGYLYNWDAAKGITTSGSTSYKNVCPTGWHVPSDGELTSLITHLGGADIAGGKMKSTDTTLWLSNIGANNESGLTVLPGGARNNFGSFSVIRKSAFIWSATESNFSHSAWFLLLYNGNGYVLKSDAPKQSGRSVRCLKD